MDSQKTTYEFGDFAFDASEQRLARRDGSHSVPVTGKAFDALVFLLEHAGEPLEKETLLGAIWPGSSSRKTALPRSSHRYGSCWARREASIATS